MKKIYLTFLAAVMSFTGCQDKIDEDISQEPTIQTALIATVLEINENSLLVESDEYGKISVSTDVRGGKLPDIKTGDKIKIAYNGYILESYPLQINTVYEIVLWD